MSQFENIKNKILSYEDEIKKYFKWHWKTVKSRKELSKEFFEKEFWNELEKYNQKTEDFNDYMLFKEKELNDIEDKKRLDKEKLDTVLIKLKKNLELLEQENISLEEINSDLNEYKDILLNFSDRFKNSTSKIDELIEWVVKYEKIAIDDVTKTLEKSKKEIEEYFEEEKQKIQKFLEKKSKKVINEKYNSEKLKLDNEKKEYFHFDSIIIIKYILLLWLVFWIATIDFMLVQQIVVDEFDLDRTIKETELIFKLVHYIIPLLPSFVLIFWEFLVRKFLKKKNIFSWFIHIISFLSISFIIITVFLTFKDNSLQLLSEWNMYDLLTRILIFAIAVPVTIEMMLKFFKTDEFFEFIKTLFKLILIPFIFIYQVVKYLFLNFILKSRKDKLLVEGFTYNLDTSEFNKILTKNHKIDNLFAIPSTFNEDLNQVSIKTEKALSNIKDLQSFLNKDIENNGIWKTLNLKIERLKEDIQSIWKDTMEQEELIDKKYQKDIDNIHWSMKTVKDNRRIYKSNYEKNRKVFETAIDEALSLIK